MSYENGDAAEQLAARKYNLDEYDGDTFDLINPRTGTVYEVKSAERDRRFRLWEDQHRSLVGKDAQGTAWYVFVLGDHSSYRRVKPETVTEIVNRRGGWNDAGHEIRESRQLKIPTDVIL